MFPDGNVKSLTTSILVGGSLGRPGLLFYSARLDQIQGMRFSPSEILQAFFNSQKHTRLLACYHLLYVDSPTFDVIWPLKNYL